MGTMYFIFKTIKYEQKEALEWQMDFASERDLPLNIHLRDAMGDFLGDSPETQRIEREYARLQRQPGIISEIQRLGDWRIGVGGVVTFKNAGLAEVVGNVPLDRIVLETDAPYLTPSPAQRHT